MGRAACELDHRHACSHPFDGKGQPAADDLGEKSRVGRNVAAGRVGVVELQERRVAVHGGQDTRNNERVRICTWNILLGMRLNAVLAAVRALPDFHHLDLFAIQEASVHDGRHDAEFIAETIAEATGGAYSFFQATAQLFRGREQGNALIWRRGMFDQNSPQVVSLSDFPSPPMSRAERALLRAIPPQKRIAIRAESPELRVYVMHLDVLGFTHKLEQFRAIINDTEARPPVRRTIIAGDLNTFGPPRLQLWRRIRSAAHDAGLVELTHGLRRTHWTAQKLDAIYVRGPVAARRRAWTLNVRASDHLPVFAEF
jgi:endonuclease/exonuclease/phosphatase family metal-dependent hydrolase